LTDLGVSVNFGTYPGFIPGTAVSIVVALVLSGTVARRLGTSRGVAWLLVASLGSILAVALTPGRGAPVPQPSPGGAACDVTRFGPASWAEYLQLGETTFNVLLFIPLGIAVALLPRSRIKSGIVLGAVTIPLAIETIQLAAAPLGRACQSADVFDNLTGLAIGLGAGLALIVLRRRI
jgi:hypothetical protein